MCLHSAHILSLDIAISIVTVEGFIHGGQKALWRSSIHMCVTGFFFLCVWQEELAGGHLIWSSMFYAPIGTWVQKHKIHV